ncbi:MAG: GH32 C-terminal domain-containing protein [Anaerococcus sp.]|nr:GH32 C-terminal domain-containing protein [Anaerococcus sp.]
MENKLDKANKFVEAEKGKVVKKFYPDINFAGPIGWINDPNGLSLVGDDYHLFYQYHPYSPDHGPMHWGHAKSKDGLNWQDLPIALAPDKDYDKDGVFSGSAISKDDNLYLMYTGNLVGDKFRQNQNIAWSKDLVNFEKIHKNPVLDEADLPSNISREHFRDPKIISYKGRYYAVIGTKTDDEVGTVLVYESDDLENWTYKSILLSDTSYLGKMAECPDLLIFGQKALLLVSAMDYFDGSYTYPHKTLMVYGQMDFDKFTFTPLEKREMDLGFDYYAPQSVKEDGGFAAISWQQNWGEALIPGILGHKWMGQMTILQKIFLKEGRIKRSIHPKVLANKNLVESIEDIGSISIKTNSYIKIQFAKRGAKALRLNFKNPAENFSFDFNIEENTGYLDRSKIKYMDLYEKDNFKKKEFNLDFEDENKLEIIFDKSSIQIYINDTYSISNTYYSENPLADLEISLLGDGRLDRISTYKLKED